MSYEVSEKEIANAEKVAELLSQIGWLAATQQTDINRPDLFIVSEAETGLDVVVDVEDDTVISMIEIETYPNGLPNGLAEQLLRANNGAVHGAFVLTPDNKVVFKSTLEVENLDLNELEASVKSVFIQSFIMLEQLSNEEGE